MCILLATEEKFCSMELIKLQYNVSVSFGIIFCSSALHLLQMLMFTRGSPFDELLAVIC